LQRKVALKSKLWEKSTGAKTPEGKAIVSQNAHTTGLRETRALIKEMNKMFKEYKNQEVF
jgi:hypothetical protein